MEPSQNEFKVDKYSQCETKNQYKASLIVLLGALCGGNIAGWTAPVLPQLKIPQNSTETMETIQLSTLECGLVGASLSIGVVLFSIPSGYLADKFGFKKIILLSNVFLLIHWILVTFATNVYMLSIGRMISGVAVGALCLCLSVYIGEISIPSIRGKLVSFVQVFLCSGILMSYIMGILMPWRFMSATLGLGPILYGILFYFMPESPIYLVKSHKHYEALKSLRYFRGIKYDCQEELDTYIKAFSVKKRVSYRDLFTKPQYKKALLTSCGIMVFQQLCGLPVMIYYVTFVFQSSGALEPAFCTIIYGVVQTILAYATSMIIEKADRRVFLMFSSTGMGICLVALGIYFHLQALEINMNYTSLVPVAIVLLYTFAYSIGYGPIPWMYLSEIFPNNIKGTASGIAVMVNFLFIAIVASTFPSLKEAIGGHYTFYIYAVFMVIGTLFAYTHVVETRGKSLQEIQDIFNE